MALYFNPNSNQKVSLGTTSGLQNNGQRSVLAWIYPTASPSANNGLIFSKATSGWSVYQYFDVRESGSGLKISHGAACSASDAHSRSSDILALNQWHCVAGRMDVGTTNKIYFGGLSTTLAEVSAYDDEIVGGGSVNSDSSAEAAIGNYGFYPASWSRFPGHIAVVVVWNAVLSVAELRLQQFHLLGPIVQPQNCKLFINLGWNGMSTQADWSGNGYNGTVSGATVSDHVPLPFPQRPQLPFVISVGSTPLLINNVSHSLAFDSLNLSQNIDLIVDDAQSSNSLDSVNLNQSHFITIDDATNSNTLDNVSIIQNHSIVISDYLHANTLDEVNLTQSHILSVYDSTNFNTLDSVSLTQGHSIIVDSSTNQNSLDNVNLTQLHTISIDDVSHQNTLDNVNLTLNTSLAINNVSHQNPVDNILLSQMHNILIDGLLHNNNLDQLQLTQNHVIVIDDLNHTNTLDNVILFVVPSYSNTNKHIIIIYKDDRIVKVIDGIDRNLEVVPDLRTIDVYLKS